MEKKEHLSIEVVDNNIPLLLGRPSMTKLGMILDTRNHSVTVNGKSFKLELNQTGHYILPVSEFTTKGTKIILHMQHLSKYSQEEKMQKARKLHRQFAHASKDRLLRLLKDSGCKDKEFMKIVEQCCEECEFCLKFQTAKPRPVVGLPKAQRFNQVVSMDLKEVEKGKTWILHLVDNATRYTAAAIIHTKKKETIVKKIFQIWLAYFGSPEKFHSDCGGEFENYVFKEMAEGFGIEISTTPGEAPFSNGVVERGNKMLYETMLKTQEDMKCSIETALAWAVSAKNSLQNVSGYSPNQLVFGRNVNLPSVADDKPPALDQPCQSDLVRENLNALHKARENFIKSESSEKIRRALRHNIRTYSEITFNPGEKVYFKCRNDKKWRGPAKVLGKESNFVLIRQGASYYRCHPCNLVKVNPNQSDIEEKTERQNTSPTVPTEPKSYDFQNTDENDTEEEEDDEEENNTANEETVPVLSDNSYFENENNNAEIDDSVSEEDKDLSAEFSRKSNEKEHRALRALRSHNNPGLKESLLPQLPRNKKKSEEKKNETEDVELLKTSNAKPLLKTTIHYQLENGEQARAHVLSSQKNWVNVRVVGQDEPSQVDWRRIVWWREIGETEHIFTLTAFNEQEEEVVEAKEREIKNLVDHDVFESVEDVGQKAVSCRWVFSEKQKEDGSKLIKARLVARGFEERLVEKRVDSPTCSRQSLRLGLIAATSMDWELHVMDITSAFLQGNKLERTVFVRPPPEVCDKGKIWKLKRCLYGLADAPREWYDRVHEEMIKLGATVSVYDKSVFMWHEKSKLVGLIITHVDDFEYCGTLPWKRDVIEKLAIIFKISKNEKGSFKYVGLNIEQNGQQIFVDQNVYCNELQEMKIPFERKKMPEADLTEEEKKKLKSICGQVLWATSQTRPDGAFDGCYISNYGEPKVKGLIEANKAVRKLKTDQLKIVYPDLGEPENMKVVVYGDGSHASLPSGASQGGNLVFLTGNDRAAPITWKSKRLDRITKSPLATEISAVADAADHGHLVASMTQELFCLPELPQIELFTDSRSLKEHLDSKKIISDPRLRVDIARLREMNELKEVNFKWVPSGRQLADCLTKKGASTELLRKVLATGVLPEHLAGQK